MYTNIDTGHALQVVGDWLNGIADQPPHYYPLEAVKEAMAIAKCNGIFRWGNKNFIQLCRIAIGTSSAFMRATAYFGTHEINKLIPTYEEMLLLFCCLLTTWLGCGLEMMQAGNNSKKIQINLGY